MDSSLNALDIAEQLAYIAPLMGMTPLDASLSVLRAPKLLAMSPSEIISAMMNLRMALPTEVDPATIICQEPALLTTLGVEFVVADVMAELRNVLPEVCVIWLISEEPKLLHGIPLQRLEQLRETVRTYQESMDDIEADEDAASNDRYMMWFQNVFVDYY